MNHTKPLFSSVLELTDSKVEDVIKDIKTVLLLTTNYEVCLYRSPYEELYILFSKNSEEEIEVLIRIKDIVDSLLQHSLNSFVYGESLSDCLDKFCRDYFSFESNLFISMLLDKLSNNKLDITADDLIFK